MRLLKQIWLFPEWADQALSVWERLRGAIPWIGRILAAIGARIRHTSPTPQSTKPEAALTPMQTLLGEWAQWIVEVEPPDHSDRRASLTFSFDLEKVYGFLEDAFVPSYHDEARAYVKKHGNTAKALATYLDLLSERIRDADLDPQGNLTAPPDVGDRGRES